MKIWRWKNNFNWHLSPMKTVVFNIYEGTLSPNTLKAQCLNWQKLFGGGGGALACHLHFIMLTLPLVSLLNFQGVTRFSDTGRLD